VKFVNRKFQYKLVFDDAVLVDSGMYGCAVENKLGKIQRVFRVIIVGMIFICNIYVRNGVALYLGLTAISPPPSAPGPPAPPVLEKAKGARAVPRI